MQIVIDEADLAAAVQRAVQGSITDALSAWPIRCAAQEAATAALAKIDFAAMVGAVVERDVEAAVTAALGSPDDAIADALRVAMREQLRHLARAIVVASRADERDYTGKREQKWIDADALLDGVDVEKEALRAQIEKLRAENRALKDGMGDDHR